MLDEGVRLAFEHLGLEYRTVCYVEREAPAAAQLVALMEAGIIDPAPVWSDLVTFRGRDWRGRVDCVTAGFPCQPHSVAGKREGLDDERWIWPDITRLIGDVGPRFVLLENVPGLASTGGLAACLGDLANLGFDAEVGRLSAAAVGAAHERERLFIFAWLADDDRRGLEGERISRLLDRERAAQRDDVDGCDQPGELGDAIGGRHDRRTHVQIGGSISRTAIERAGRAVGDSSRDGRHEGRSEPGGQQGRPHAAEPVSTVADSSSPRPQGRELDGARNDAGGGQEAHGSVSELCGAFAPGPSDPRWPAILEDAPYLAPAIAAGSVRVWWDDAARSFVAETPESSIRGVADGLALVVDESRSDQLRAVGNGVVALQAAAAFVALVQRAWAARWT
jgi:DNA (cytosine-5)-methyltransferase 1